VELKKSHLNSQRFFFLLRWSHIFFFPSHSRSIKRYILFNSSEFKKRNLKFMHTRDYKNGEGGNGSNLARWNPHLLSILLMYWVFFFLYKVFFFLKEQVTLRWHTIKLSFVFLNYNSRILYLNYLNIIIGDIFSNHNEWS
jgi:hypothetical protein